MGRLLTAAAALSLVAAAMLAAGYVSQLVAVVERARAGSPGTYHAFCVLTDGGGVGIDLIYEEGFPTAYGVPRSSPGFHTHAYAQWLGRPDLKRVLWEFDAHPVVRPRMRVFILATPIWFCELPCGVLPVLWRRRRQKRERDREGFAVVPLTRS
jgi:hypothetical protein